MPSGNNKLPVHKVTRIVFTALLLDILAFTIILPLFPRLLQYYQEKEHGDQSTLLAWSLRQLTAAQGYFGLDDPSRPFFHKRPPKMDIVLLGGALGSLFSVLQFVASPIIGKLSDLFGRRRVLLFSMLLVLSRIIGGLSEGNVQLSIAVISDITTPATRSKGLALVGIAFAIGFTVGPALGAYFASKDLVTLLPSLAQYGLHPFSASALLCLTLLSIESLYLFVALPETTTEQWRKTVREAAVQEGQQQVSSSSSTNKEQARDRTKGKAQIMDKEEEDAVYRQQHAYLRRLSLTHFAHLFLFSGMEFTLTFLTFHLFDFSHMQQGALLGYIGILSSLIQGGYVRRKAHTVGEKRMVVQGIWASAIGLGCIALVAGGTSGSLSSGSHGEMEAYSASMPDGVLKNVLLWVVHATKDWSRSTRMMGLYAGATGLAVTSSTVVNCLTSLASLVCDMKSTGSSADRPTHGSASSSTTPSAKSSTTIASSSSPSSSKEPLGKGLALGRFRSWGQLGRAMGPIAACSLYWRVGPMLCYGIASVLVAFVAILARRILPEAKNLLTLERRTTGVASKKNQ
ncbi:hypothetical protein DFQ27_004371 [Actinomortierella ambigua]|uniref:Major facilitator superfamily (MFS) profile domain-containing protein n=1 Tax=Actinomortierella ambigua TaxID=1343610 RepID=A0A9P6U3I7_9FUNG|nr:hypothetical protein DFQ27_004371 [Actinomortierella ambigua]